MAVGPFLSQPSSDISRLCTVKNRKRSSQAHSGEKQEQKIKVMHLLILGQVVEKNKPVTVS